LSLEQFNFDQRNDIELLESYAETALKTSFIIYDQILYILPERVCCTVAWTGRTFGLVLSLEKFEEVTLILIQVCNFRSSTLYLQVFERGCEPTSWLWPWHKFGGFLVGV
jgi:hypothetical protein